MPKQQIASKQLMASIYDMNLGVTSVLGESDWSFENVSFDCTSRQLFVHDSEASPQYISRRPVSP